MKTNYWLPIVAALGLSLLVTGCGAPAEEAAVSETVTTSAPAEEAAPEEGGTLVAVFSLANNADWKEDVDALASATFNAKGDGLVGDTMLLAEVAQEVSDGDLYQIVAEKPYPADEAEVYTQAQKEQLDQARPALKTSVDDMDAYSTIILIYPNWWGGLPMPVATFLEAYDLSDKTLIPICSYDAEGSGTEKNREVIEDLCDAYVTKSYKVRSGGASTKGTRIDLKNWLNELPVHY